MDNRRATLLPLCDLVSERVRRRLAEQGLRYFANDNIAAGIAPGELPLLVDEVAGHLQAALRALVIDVDNDHNTLDTSRRLARMFIHEVFGGRYVPQPAITAFPNVEQLDELMVVGPIQVRSACSHHFCPVLGKVWIAIVPDAQSQLIGLSKYVRIVHWVMTRPQIQEEAVLQLAQVLREILKPRGLALVLEADHLCMQWRGVRDSGAQFTNSTMQGVFRDDPALRNEFLSLIRR